MERDRILKIVKDLYGMKELEIERVISEYPFTCKVRNQLKYYFLKKNRLVMSNRRSIRNRHSIITFLADRGVKTPRLLLIKDGYQNVGQNILPDKKGFFYEYECVEMYDWVDMQDYTDNAFDSWVEEYFRFAENAAEYFDMYFDRNSFTVDKMMKKVLLYWDELDYIPSDKRKDGLIDKAINLIIDEQKALVEYLQKQKITVIHGDLNRKNIGVQGDNVVALLDFERSGVGYQAEDIAMFLYEFCIKDKEWKESQSYIEHFQKRVEVENPQVWNLRMLLILAANSFLGYIARSAKNNNLESDFVRTVFLPGLQKTVEIFGELDSLRK
ncbi:homoserine kinase [Clostridium tepidiprofundi DSM 19306]|uniref:Homoserine kinase n=1 Tax=Clostridium tepidiprofundi DSM 19306 TaxID=1121338 RepID=A0A151B2R4_9CLOT|nr:aminoglycoside phosphotransferase family protein [Clostridium tepidiprofundi]KYH33957.1 homoserine kinase [Clostridium tepidiprofundi DSM 19306]